MDNTQNKPSSGRVILRVIQVLIYAAIFASIFFISAGSFKLIWGWVFLAINFAFNLTMTLTAGESLLKERSKRHADAKTWDLYLSLVPILSQIAILVVSGLDVGRGHWTPELSPWVHGVAAIIFTGSLAFNTWAVRTNRFYSNVVRIQADRGHQVIDTGPYAIIRHPTYAMAHVIHISLAIMLGSYWALIPALIGSLGLILRTSLEDKTLQAELPGYADYCRRVKYRMIPGIW